MDTTQPIFTDIMLDIETMGNMSYSSIISIGALKFNIKTGITGPTFYENISLDSCLKEGLIVNASTIMWWMEQSEEARKKLKENVKPLKEVLHEFSLFCTKEYDIWGNSTRFDCGILQNAYDKVGIPIPWDFRKERCVRTIVALNPSIKQATPRNNVEHNALHDCYHQAQYVSATYNSLNL